jgi:hypothetical protein
MSININPVDFRGFSLGGGSTPQLPNIGALGLQALQMRMSQQESDKALAAQQAMNLARIRSADEAMLRQSGLERDKINQQAYQFDKNYSMDKRKLGLLDKQNTQENDLKKYQLDMQNAQANNQLGLSAAELDTRNQKASQQAAFEQMKLGIQEMAKKDKEELNNIGSFAAQAQISLSQEKDPAKAHLLRNEITDQAVEFGLISKDQAKQFKQLPLSQFMTATGMLGFQANKAKEMHAAMKGQADTSLTISPDGTVNYQSVGKKAKDKAEEGLIQTNANFAELKDVLNNVTPDMFGPAAAKASMVTPAQEWLSGVPGLGSLKPDEQDAEAASKFAEINGQLNRLAMDTIKQESGLAYTNEQLQFMMKFIPTVGPGTTELTFKGKAAALTKYLERSREAKQKVLDKGIEFNSDPDSKFGRAYLNELQALSKEVEPSAPKSYKWNPATKKLEPM